MQTKPVDHIHTPPIASMHAFNNPRVMQPVLDLLVTCHDEDLRAILIHGLVEHVMRGSHYAPAGDERRDAIEDFATIVGSLGPYDADGGRRAWLIGVLMAAWTAPRDGFDVAAWTRFIESERRALWAIVHDTVRHIRTLPRTDDRDQALCTLVQQIGDAVARMSTVTQAADVRHDAPMQSTLGTGEAYLDILPILRDCHSALHAGDIEPDDPALAVCDDSLSAAVAGLVESGSLPPDARQSFHALALSSR